MIHLLVPLCTLAASLTPGRMHAVRVNQWRLAHRAVRSQLDHHGTHEFSDEHLLNAQRASASRAFQLESRRQHTLSAYDEQDAILSDIDNLICHSPHVTLASAIGLQDRREASPTTADDTTAVDNEECYLLDGDDGQLFYMCTSPPSDNGNLQCEETADGLDWVCIADHGGYAA